MQYIVLNKLKISIYSTDYQPEKVY